jgi:hypothetical protein
MLYLLVDRFFGTSSIDLYVALNLPVEAEYNFKKRHFVWESSLLNNYHTQ